MMENYERIEQLKEAQDALRRIVEDIKDAVRGTSVSNTANAYLIPALEVAIDDESEWLGGNPGNLQSLIDDLSAADSTDDTEDDESEDAEIDSPVISVSAPAARIIEMLTIPAEVLVLIDQGQRINATKRYREINQCGLKEAIDAVRYIRDHRATFNQEAS